MRTLAGGAGAPGHSVGENPTSCSRRKREREFAGVHEIWNIHVFFNGVNLVLAGAEGDGGYAVAHEPVGVESAVGDAQAGVPAERSCRGQGRLYHRAPFLELEGVIVPLAREANLGVLAVRVRDPAGGATESVAVGQSDGAAELAVVAARLAPD